MSITLYGDVHSSEASARYIQRMVEIEDPEAVLIELPDNEAVGGFDTRLRLANAEYARNFARPLGDAPLYSYTKGELERTVDSLDSKEEEPPFYSALTDILSRKDPETTKNTLPYRLVDHSNYLESSCEEVIPIDVNRHVMYERAADNLEKLPDRPSAIEAMLDEDERLEQLSIEEAMAIDEMIERYGGFQREEAMAQRINMVAENLEDVELAGVVGKDHIPALHRLLEQRHGIETDSFVCRDSGFSMKPYGKNWLVRGT